MINVSLAFGRTVASFLLAIKFEENVSTMAV